MFKMVVHQHFPAKWKSDWSRESSNEIDQSRSVFFGRDVNCSALDLHPTELIKPSDRIIINPLLSESELLLLLCVAQIKNVNQN